MESKVLEDKFIILDADVAHHEERSVVRIVAKRVRDKKKMILYDADYRHYFYVIPSDEEHLDDLKNDILSIRVFKGNEKISVENIEVVKKKLGLEEVKALKVYLKKMSHYQDIKDIIKNFPYYGKKLEKDIPMVRHYFSDKGVSGGKYVTIRYEIKENVFRDIAVKEVGVIKNIEEVDEFIKEKDMVLMAFDIETIQENSQDKIFLLSYVTNDGKKGVISLSDVSMLDADVKIVGSEKELLEEFSYVLNDIEPDIVFTYNGDEFDLLLMKNKMESYGLSYPYGFGGKKIESHKRGRTKAHYLYGRVHFDLYQFVSRVLAPTLNVEVLTLDAVANELIGERKKEMTFSKMEELWEKSDIKEIAEYCLHDALITLKLGRFLFHNIISLSDITKLLLDDVSRSTYGNLVENYAIRRCKKTGTFVPNKPGREEVSERYMYGEYEGAFVYEPTPGLYENIVVLDFRSLYPSIIITHNIDPYTLIYECRDNPNKVPDYEYCFLMSPKGFIPDAMEHIYNKRVMVKEKLKTLEKSSPEYVERKAEDYALKTILNSFYGYLGYINSRWYKRECAQAATSFGRYYIRFIINKAKEKGFKVIYGDTDSVFISIKDENIADVMSFAEQINTILPGIIKLEYQGFYKRGIFVSKKEKKGGAKKRYALIDKEGNILIRGFERVRRDWCRLAKDAQEMVLRYVLEGEVEKAKEYVRKIISDIRKGNVKKEDLIIYVKLQRSIESYEVNAPHIAVAKKIKQKGGKIFSGMIIPYIVTSKPGKISDKAEIYYEAEDYDVDYYINNQILPAVMRVFSALNISEEEILSGKRQKTLF